MGNIIGSTMNVAGALENLAFIRKSKEDAKAYDWLYHCTSVDALISMIQNREMWLSNLQVVNDKVEAGRIDVEEYEKSYYVACFTYDSDIPKEHWREYGQSDQKILFGMKREWVKKQVDFLNIDHTKCDMQCFKICKSFHDAIEYEFSCGKKGECVSPPYYIIDYGFYKIVYDDELKKKIKTNSTWEIDGEEINGVAITYGVPGTIKSTHGMCIRNEKEPYEKDWTSEKEVRLKVGVTTNNVEIKKTGVFFRQMAIQLTDDAFSELPIKFSPDMSDEKKNICMKRIKEALPNANVYEI